MTKFEKEVDAKREAMDRLRSLFRGRWMVAIWEINENGQLALHRFTWQYPVAAFEESIQRLHENLEQESVPEELPVADFLREVKSDMERKRKEQEVSNSFPEDRSLSYDVYKEEEGGGECDS